MTALIVLIAVLVVLGAALALAEAAISRTSASRAAALHEQGRRNAALLEKIEDEPARYLNAVYLAVMFTQNGSAILVAIVAERYFGEWGHHGGFDRLHAGVLRRRRGNVEDVRHPAQRHRGARAGALRLHHRPHAVDSDPRADRPGQHSAAGKGLKSGPFVTQAEIRSMAEVGHQEGSIEQHEKEIITRCSSSAAASCGR